MLFRTDYFDMFTDRVIFSRKWKDINLDRLNRFVNRFNLSKKYQFVKVSSHLDRFGFSPDTSKDRFLKNP